MSVTNPAKAPDPVNASPWFTFDTNYLSTYQKNCYEETVRLFGFDVKYIPLEFISSDINYVFGEINKVNFPVAYSIRMKVEGYDDLHKALLSYNKFGLFIQPDSVEVSVSKNDYETIVSSTDKPRAGDLIYITIHDENILFEVASASLKFDSFYLFSIKLYNYNALTDISTGVPGIDNVANVLDNVSADFNQNDKIAEINNENEDFEKPNSIWGTY